MIFDLSGARAAMRAFVSVVAVALGGACGANVVFVGDEAAGGRAGAGGDSAGGSTPGRECTAAFVGERLDRCYGSVEPPCPAADSQRIVDKALQDVVLLECPDKCCNYFLNGIPCGPVVGTDGESCCYGIDISKAIQCDD